MFGLYRLLEGFDLFFQNVLFVLKLNFNRVKMFQSTVFILPINSRLQHIEFIEDKPLKLIYAILSIQPPKPYIWGLFRLLSTETFLASLRIFNARQSPSVPNFGGLWESRVTFVKYHLRNICTFISDLNFWIMLNHYRTNWGCVKLKANVPFEFRPVKPVRSHTE